MSELKSPTATSRCGLLVAGAGAAAGIGLASSALSTPAPSTHSPRPSGSGEKISFNASTITMKDGTEIYYKDWGTGPAVVFCHGYPLSSDAWEDQMLFLAQQGYRVIAHDRRGFGRSS